MLRRSAPALLLALAFAAMAGPVAASEGSLLVGSLAVEGPAAQQGSVAMVFVKNVGLPGDAPATPWLAGHAARLDSMEFWATSHEASAPSTGVPVDTVAVPGDTGQDPPQTFTDVQLALAEFQGPFELHAFAVGGTLDYSGSSDRRVLEPRERMSMSVQGFDGEPSANPSGLDSPSFATIDRDGPFVLHAGPAARSQLTLRGDFILEIDGLTVEAAAAEGTHSYASGRWRTPVTSSGGPAYDVEERFVRLFLEDAEIEIAVDGADARMEWASAQVDLEPSGPVTLYRSTGILDGEQMTGARHVLEPGSVLAVLPKAEGLQVSVADAALGTRGGTIADVPAPASAALVGSGAVLALLIAIGIGLLRRVLRQPQLAEVERAIEDGEYRRAARLAARILARRPDDESAILARGIALSKAGDHRRTVAELSDHLAQRPASDGSLHYVLGLAQLDLGQKDAGRASLREAVRLTPSLQAEVGSRLGKVFSSPPPTTREASGYA